MNSLNFKALHIPQTFTSHKAKGRKEGMMPKSIPGTPVVQFDVVYYLLWTREIQEQYLSEFPHEKNMYKRGRKILTVVPKKGNPSAVLFQVEPFHLSDLDDGGEKYDTDMVFPKIGKTHNDVISAYSINDKNLVSLIYRAEYYQLFIIPTKMQKAFEAQILEEHPDCILT